LQETLHLLRRAKAQATVSRMRDDAEHEGLADMDQAEIEAEVAAARSERARR
jgi:hypothetical protein